MYFYFLLTPWVYVGISTKFLVLDQKRRRLTKYQTLRLGFQPKTCGNLIDRSSLFYHYARSTREILQFPKHYQLWFSAENWPRYGQTQQESDVGRWLIYQIITGIRLLWLISHKPPHHFLVFCHIFASFWRKIKVDIDLESGESRALSGITATIDLLGFRRS